MTPEGFAAFTAASAFAGCAAWNFVMCLGRLRGRSSKKAAIALLTDVGAEMLTQENDGTAHPVFEVWQKVRMYGIGTDWHFPSGWSEIVDGDEREVTCLPGESDWSYSEPDPDDESGPLDDHVIPYKDDHAPVDGTASLTRSGAEAYIVRHDHDLREPIVRVGSLCGMPEMREIMEALKTLGGGA